MIEIGKVTSVKNGQKQIDYLNSIIYTLEELKGLYGQNDRFQDDIKDVDSQIEYCEELKQQISGEMKDFIDIEIRKQREEEEQNRLAWDKERM